MKTINLKKEINLNFRDRIATIEDLDKVQGIEEDINAFYNEETKSRYFTFDAVEKIQQAYKDGAIRFYVPSKEEWQVAIDIAGGYKELRDTIDLPYNGVLLSHGERNYVGVHSNLWSSTPHNDDFAYYVWFNARGDCSQSLYYRDIARSLVFIQG